MLSFHFSDLLKVLLEHYRKHRANDLSTLKRDYLPLNIYIIYKMLIIVRHLL